MEEKDFCIYKYYSFIFLSLKKCIWIIVCLQASNDIPQKGINLKSWALSALIFCIKSDGREGRN